MIERNIIKKFISRQGGHYDVVAAGLGAALAAARVGAKHFSLKRGAFLAEWVKQVCSANIHVLDIRKLARQIYAVNE